jgi:hypothetical protein
MGQGIIGAIPTSFRFKKGRWESDEAENKKEFAKHAAKDFFDFYNKKQIENEKGSNETWYTIKPEILLPNFKDFFIDFHNLIGNTESIDTKKFNENYDQIVAFGNMEEFLKYFDDYGYPPRLFEYFDAMYINTNRQDLLVYQGSYKAFLEEWSTIRHMEYLLRAAMQNPLAKIVRLGMSL